MRNAVLCALLCALCALTAVQACAADDDVVAKIGEKKYTLTDFNRWLTYNPATGQKDSMTENKMKAAMLHQVITAMVIADLARKEGFDKRPDIHEKMTFVLNNFLTLEYLDKVVSAQVKASEDHIKAYYEQNKDKYKTRETVRARHILIKAEKTAPEGERQQARKKAEEILAKVRVGGDFSVLAAEFSEDPGSKARGGDLGWFGRSQMAPEFEKAAFSLAPGGVSEVVETKFGYHIIRLDGRKEATYQPLAEVEASISEKLTRDKRLSAVDEFVKKAMKDADATVDVRPVVGSDPHFGQ